MKKIITLLFILAFTSTTFAARILTIRNSSTETRGFYALEMVMFDPNLLPGPYLHTVTGHYIQLEPGGFITFSHASGINDFGYCPTGNYTIKPLLDYPDIPTDSFYWRHATYEPPVPGEEFKLITTTTTKCSQVPQLSVEYAPRAIFRGFKIDDIQIGSNGIRDYFIPKHYDFDHRYSNYPGYNGDYVVKEKLIRLPPGNNPTLEIHEIIFL